MDIKLAAFSAAILCLSATAALGAELKQPPMDNFNNAYYTCDSGNAFLMSYDSGKPKSATLTTSNNSKTFKLKKTSAASGIAFAGDNVKFSTDGDMVTVDGTEIPLTNCKRKTS